MIDPTENSDAAEDGEISVTTPSPAKRSRRWWIGLGSMVLGGLITLTFGWILITGLAARSQLTAARTEIAQLRGDLTSNQIADVRSKLADIAAHTRRAHQLTTGPIWSLAASVPGVGAPLQTMRGITDAADFLGNTVLPPIMDATRNLDPAKLRLPNGGVDVDQIAALRPALDSADAALAVATQRVQGLPVNTWLSPVDNARSSLLSQLGSLGQTLHSADLTAQILPPMLGVQKPQTYLLVFQNDAEARGTGGLPGAFAVVTADHGKIMFDSFHSSGLAGSHADVHLGADYDHLYSNAGTTTLYGNANLSPNFPYAAQIWASMWKQRSGQQVDGVIAVDPSALSYFLAATGPAELADKTMVSASNVVALTQSTVYAMFPAANENDARRGYLLDIARAVGVRLVSPSGNIRALLTAATRAADERRLLIWSSHPAIQTQLGQTNMTGEIPVTPAPYAGLSIVNDGGNKLDYYLDRTLTWESHGCAPTREVTATITLTNTAPSAGLSDYVTGRSDQHSHPVKRGDNRLEVGYLATSGAILESITIDGNPGTTAIGAERGHPVYTVDLELPRGTARTIVLHLVEPFGASPPLVLRQPLVRPLLVNIRQASCS